MAASTYPWVTEADAISIGGGLAGAAFAIELARHGAKVVVLERTETPALKVCGDFLSAEALDLLSYLGLDIASRGAAGVETLTMATGASAANIALPFRAAGFSRLALDETLLEAARDAGAHVCRGRTVTSLDPSSGRAIVRCGKFEFHAGAVALATGKHNLRGWPRGNGTAAGFKLQFLLSAAARQALSRHVQLVLFDGGYVGASLVEGDLATICWQIEERQLRRIGPAWRAQLAHFSSHSDLLGDLLTGAQPTTPRPAAVARLPFGYIRRKAIANSVYPIGDQMAVIPAFTGDGTSIALASGIHAAQAVMAGRTAADFQARFARALKHQFSLARTVSGLFRHAATRRLSIGTIRMFPSVATAMARATRLRAIDLPR